MAVTFGGFVHAIALACICSAILSTLTTGQTPEPTPDPEFNCVNVTTNCSANAIATFGGYINQFGDPTCNCTCNASWTGERCLTCPVNYDEADNCASCAFGYIDYPNCTDDRCTRADCNDHSSRESGFRSTNCTCTCINQWQGATCDYCPEKYYNGDGFCGSCAEGYDPSSYPNCYPLCDITANCSDHATVVRGNVVDGCNCTCVPGWQGQECETCPPNFEGSNCNRCAPGYASFPFCVPCTRTLNCSGRAREARYNSETGECQCIDCRNSWEGDRCQDCPPEYSRVADCGACNTAQGFAGDYPNCDRVCTSENACSGHALQVNGTFRSGCQCLRCDGQWTGAQCELCPEKYDATRNCKACARDRENDYPTCTLKPTTPPPPTTTTAAPTTTVEPASTTTAAPSSTDAPTSSGAPNASTTTPAPTNNGTAPTPPPTPPSTPPPTRSEAREPTKTEVPPSPTHHPTPTATKTHNITGSISLTENITASTSLSDTRTICPGEFIDCWLLTNNSVPNTTPTNCACVCRNMWETNTCNYCQPRYNSSAEGDCGVCSLRHYFYPTCDYGLFLHGNFTPHWSDPALVRKLLQANLMLAIAEDLTNFVNNLTCNEATNVTGYVLSYDDATNKFAFDVDVLSANATVVHIAADCIMAALNSSTFPLNATKDLIESVFPGQNVTVDLGIPEMELSEESPCDGWCQNGAAPTDPEEPAPEDDNPFPWWIIIVVLALLATVVAGAAIYRRYKHVEALKLNRVGLRERILDPGELSYFNQEMEAQKVLPGGRVPDGSERAGSRVVRHANAPVEIPQDDI